MIYHITTHELWKAALKKGFYEAPTLHSEGFIHTSFAQHIDGVLKRYYQGKENLLLLHVDEDKIIAEIRYELSPSINQTFPHIYGPVNIDAVVKTSEIEDGNYTLS